MIFAIGGGVSVYYTQPYAEQTITQPAPEAVIYAYLPLGKHLYLRPGARINYSWDQNESPESLNIKETDLRYYGELGLVFNWIVLPSFSIGLGVDRRTTTFATKPPIYVFQDNISTAENLFTTYIQTSVGFPIIRGWLMIEPYLRYTIVQNETPQGLGYGIEATVELF